MVDLLSQAASVATVPPTASIRSDGAAVIRAACAALAEGASFSEAMLGAGFATRSNFHREFRRITGETPGAWLAAQAPSEKRR